MKDKEIETSYSEDNCDSPKAGQPNSFDLAVGDKETRSTQLVFKYQGGRKVPKLREPRSLYAFCKERGIQSAPRWPAHIKVINSRIRHITTVPKDEPCELIENEVPISLCRLPDEEGKLVYDNPPGPEQYFLRSRAGGAQVPNRPFYKLGSSSDKTLIFESRFESGNLQRAIKVKEYEYQLWLRNDLYTNKHTQWFYFRVQNVRSGARYKFTIMNLLKSGSLYNDGMRPLMYSEITATKNKVGWTRIGEDIVYYKNEIRREDTIKEKYHYSLTWATEFPHDNDTCYFAHCYPYTYSDLQEYLQEIRTDPMRSRICKQRVLCRTLAGNFVYALTITNPSRRPADAEAKRAVVLTARVHPGETNSSWMMKGLIDFLTSNAPDAKLLRDTFIFKVVPMINPDGVIVGNYRCSLSGRDLNRNYKTVLKDSFPPIWHIRNMVRKLMEEREVIVYCDLHGHSRKQNVFIYGCENRFDPLKRLRERIFPVMMSKNAPTKFSYKGCKFKVQKSKEGTGRIVMWHMGITNSYTMEATFCGSSLGKNSDLHFNTKDFESMGFLLCDTLLDYCDPDDSKYVAILLDLELKLKADILERMKKKGLAPISMTEADVDFNTHYTSDIESSTGGSDSSGSDGLPMHLIYAPETLQLHQCRKKKLKTRKERNKRRAKALKVKEVVLADVVQRSGLGHTDAVLPTEAKLTYHKSPKRSGLPSPGRFKFENPRPRKHEHKDSSSRSCTPCHARPDDQAASRIDYLEAVTTAFMMNGVIVTEAKEVPQFRYTAGSAYLRERQSPSRSISRWSSDTPVPVVPEASDGEEQFTLSYMSKQLRERNSPKLFLPSESVVAPVINERNVNSAMDLARKISVYSSRAKALAAGQDLPADLQTPSLRPRTPVQPYPHYPWQPKGECLSSTKARLYEQPRPQREFAELKKSLSQLSVEDKKTKKARKKKLVSTSMTECSSFDPENGNSLLIGGKSTSSTDLPAQRRKGQSSTSSKQEEITWQLRTTTLQGTLEPQLQKPSTQLKSMKKYTGSYERVTHSIETDARSKEQVQHLSPVPSRVAPMNSPPSHGKAADQPKSNLSPWQLSSYVKPLGAQASYANVCVARGNVQPPQSKQETSLNESYSAISTINELRDKLMSMEESGNSAACSLDIQKEKRNTQVYDSSDSDNGSKGGNRAICEKPLSSGNAGLSGLEAEGVTSLRNTPQSPIAPGIVRIGLNQDRESSGGLGSKLNEQRNQDPGAAPSTISLTFQFDGTSSRDPPSQQNGPRASVFPPQLKHFYRPPHHK